MPSHRNNRTLIAGGARDPNVLALIDAARARSIDIVPLLIGPDVSPSLTWSLDGDAIVIDGEPLDPGAAFIRRDVFHGGGAEADYRALAWYTALQGWLASSPRVRALNRRYLGRYTNKLHALRMARDAGLAVPETIVTNDVAALAGSRGVDPLVAKPVNGGGYCMALGELLEKTELRDGIAATPAIVQERLVSPDVRIYRIGDRYAGFRINTDDLDYRASRSYTIEPLDHLPPAIIERLGALMDAMGLDWGAADFKRSPESDELLFLEVNSDPMFSRFDRIGDGAVTGSILDLLRA